MPSVSKRPAKKPAAARARVRVAAKARRPVAKPAPAPAKMATQRVLAKLPPAKPLPVKANVAPPKPAGGRAPGVFETKVLTALKRHGGAAVSFGTSPDHIKAAFKRCSSEGWATGTADSASLTAVGEKVLERLKPEIRAFPAPTLRNRLNDALFRNQNKAATPPAAANDVTPAKPKAKAKAPAAAGADDADAEPDTDVEKAA